MKPTKIFLDLDDVLCSFTPHALASVGCDINCHDYGGYPRECGYNIVDAANKLHRTRFFAIDEFWKEIRRDVWATAPKSFEFWVLINIAKRIAGTDNIFILTSPTNDPDCLAGKLEWIHRNCPLWMHDKYVITPHKSLCASPDALLIDDNEINIRLFYANGGKGIIFPRPWNGFHEVKDGMRYVRKKLVEIFGMEITNGYH